MVKKDITAISKVIAAKLCWVAADVENTPCGLLQHKKNLNYNRIFCAKC